MRLAPLITVAAAVLALAVSTAAPPAEAATSTTTHPAARSAASPLRGDVKVHDPALVKGGDGKDWFVFSSGEPGTGNGVIQIRRSKNGREWTYAGTIWDKIPTWATDYVQGAGAMWAPDVYEHGGTYYLYYAVSLTGKNNSVVGLATNTTLDPDDPAYKWVDQGRVIRSAPSSNFNAIDPGVVEDAAGTPWLVFGSYWTGIHMVQLEWPSGKRSSKPERIHVADRKIPLNAIEAPNIVPHDGWFYLITSWDRCCQGVESDYKIVVGRSRDVTGPYVDKDGRKLLDGGGTVIQATSGDHVGPGGQSVSGGVIAYHYYDRKANGEPRLGLKQLSFTGGGWPELTDSTA